ncbi:MAG TPA: hypothetical protein VH370_10020 [Humisphaera sp.]|jgi:hypothetical protein|nr:hypothetical protein [Humisphaera sp.]
MTRWRFNFVFALGASLALHVVLFTAAAPMWSAWLAAPARRPRQIEVAVALQLPDPLPASEADMGEDKAQGTGSNSSQGDRPMQARFAEDNQALLGRNPHGPGTPADPADLQQGPLGENGSGGQQGGLPTPVSVAVATPPTAPPEAVKPSEATAQAAAPPAVRLPEQDDTVAPSLVTADQPPIEVPKVAPQLPTTAPAQPRPQVAVAPPQPAVRPQTGDGRAPGADRRPTDPAQQSESVSDPFSRTSNAVFRDGRLDIQNGRKFKITTRPRIGLGGQADLISMGKASLLLNLTIDVSGRVTHVDVVHSSGSTGVDEPCEIAAYDWWTEPSRDKQGRPIPDVIPFTIRFE